MDPLSIAAGVVGIMTFVGQVIESIDRLKLLCKDVKDLPTEMERLVDQVHQLASVIKKLTPDDEDLPEEDHVIEAAFRYCRSASCQMVGLTVELEQSIASASGSFPKLRVATNRRVIKRAFQKLEQSKSDLLAAFLLYDGACRRHEARIRLQERQSLHQVVRQAVTEALWENRTIAYSRTIHFDKTQGRASDTPDEDKERIRKAGPQSNRSSRSNARRVSTICIQLPLWLCQAAWVISFERATRSWTLHVDMIDIIPEHHEAFGMCRRGDTKGLEALLNKKAVSLHAQDAVGNSLTRVALQHFQTELADFLIRRGARIEAPERKDYLDNNGFWICRPRYPNAEATAALTMRYVRHMQYVSEEQALEESIFGFQYLSAVDCLSTPPSHWIHQSVLSKNPDVCMYTLKAMPLLNGNIANLDDDFFALRTTSTTLSKPYCSMSYLHMLSMAWHIDGVPGYELMFPLVQAVLLRGISLGTNISALNESGRTPFTTMLEHMVGWGLGPAWGGTRIMNRAIQSWVSVLSSAGIDLEEYAQLERQLYDERDRDGEGWWKEDGVVGFSSGSKPSDWCTWPRHPGDVYCGIFWDLVESSRQQIPGTYPESERLDSDLAKWERDVTFPRARKSGLKARTLRWIRSRSLPSRHSGTEDDRHDLDDAYQIALRNATAWKKGDITDEGDERHEKLLTAMTRAGLNRPDRVGLQASLWHI